MSTTAPDSAWPVGKDAVQDALQTSEPAPPEHSAITATAGVEPVGRVTATASRHVCVQTDDFDVGAELKRLQALTLETGGVASFVGYVRDTNQGDTIDGLTLEHYPGMTERSLERICAQAEARWPLLGVTVIHRVGPLAPGDQIVLVATASRHRDAAFESCRFIMDYLKTEAPFWKKESTPDGERWVDARDSDEAARRRWEQGTDTQIIRPSRPRYLLDTLLTEAEESGAERNSADREWIDAPAAGRELP